MSVDSEGETPRAPLDRGATSVPIHQRNIYLRGTQGVLPAVPVQYDELEAAARQVMSTKAYAYVAGGAGQEESQFFNRHAFQNWQIVPRMLRDVSQRNMSMTLFGDTYASPLFLCPVGVLELAHPQAEKAVIPACQATGIPMTFSNQASVPMEECARRLGDSPRFFQLYWSKSLELVTSLVQRAEKCGCRALFVTLDTPLLGWRTRDLTLGSLPFAEGAGLAQYFTDPVFQAYLDEAGEGEKPVINLHTLRVLYKACRAYPGPFLENLKSRRPVKAIRQFLDIYSRTDLTWPDLAFLRSKTKLPIVLKGILSPEDARLALEAGVDAIMVSNHGGRQVDGSIASLDALVNVVEAVQDKVPVLFDSGIRCGADIHKALALGATAVGVGRPYVYGPALRGETGVREVLDNLVTELDLQMGLTGCRSLADLRQHGVQRRP